MKIFDQFDSWSTTACPHSLWALNVSMGSNARQDRLRQQIKDHLADPTELLKVLPEYNEYIAEGFNHDIVLNTLHEAKERKEIIDQDLIDRVISLVKASEEAQQPIHWS